MAVHLTVNAPETCVKDALCAIPCTVENTFNNIILEVKVMLYEGSTQLDIEPDLHRQYIHPGESYDFKGFWDTLTFTPTTIKTYNLKVKVTTNVAGLIEHNFQIPCIEKPGFFDSLLSTIQKDNQDQITEPIADLFSVEALPGFTAPPYTCPICGLEIKAADESDEAIDQAMDDYSSHIIWEVNKFIAGWWGN